MGPCADGFSEGHTLEWPSSLGESRARSCLLSVCAVVGRLMAPGAQRLCHSLGQNPPFAAHCRPTGSPEKFLNFRPVRINRGAGHSKGRRESQSFPGWCLLRDAAAAKGAWGCCGPALPACLHHLLLLSVCVLSVCLLGFWSCCSLSAFLSRLFLPVPLHSTPAFHGVMRLKEHT